MLTSSQIPAPLFALLLAASCLTPPPIAVEAASESAPKRPTPARKTRIQAAPRKAAPIKARPAQISLALVRKHVGALAGDRMRGRGSATDDELAAARYIAAELKRYGVQPAGENGTYLQRVALDSPIFEPRMRALGQGRMTTNVVGILRGSDPKAKGEAILLSAHLDHLGVGAEVNGDSIYNGADDDASGVTAVLELARVLCTGPRPRRTVVFTLFGSEEIGGYGATYFQAHPPVPLANFVANLEFEMIGRPDPALASRSLWMAGYERSDLGAVLASHGAPLVADPHPEQQFFRRSDNYVLAKRGIIAHTISSFGLHRDYHQPSDDTASLDFAHMTAAIQSLAAPVRWLCDSKFKPKWNPGQRP